MYNTMDEVSKKVDTNSNNHNNSRYEALDTYRDSNQIAMKSALESRDIERQNPFKYILMCILFTFISFIIVDCSSKGHGYIEQWSNIFFDWMQSNPKLGVVTFIFLYALGTVLFIPGSILTLGAGFSFGSIFGITKGWLLSSLSVFIGATLGSMAAFLLGRYLFRDSVLSLTQKYPSFRAIDLALEHHGLKIMILLRLSPLIPFNALDYMSGTTSISFMKYSVALVAIIPGVMLYSFIGVVGGAAIANDSDDYYATQESISLKVRTFTLVSGILFAGIGVGLVSLYAKRELDQIMQTEEKLISSNDDEVL